MHNFTRRTDNDFAIVKPGATMIKLYYQGKNALLSEAVEKANEVLSADAFYERIAALPEYDNSQRSFEVAALLKNTERQITILTYRNPFGSVAKIGNPSLLKVNTSKLSLLLPFAVHMLIHQAMLSISMPGNNTALSIKNMRDADESESLPRRIGEIAEIISRKARRTQRI